MHGISKATQQLQIGQTGQIGLGKIIPIFCISIRLVYSHANTMRSLPNGLQENAPQAGAILLLCNTAIFPLS